MTAADLRSIIRNTAQGVEIRLRVKANSKKEGLIGIHDGRLKISLRKPPVEGQANAALISLFAELLDLPKKSISIKSGHASKEKTLLVSGLSAEILIHRLETQLTDV